MNIDLFLKLLRLSANNTNDNEANLAARKACKMLDDALKGNETVTLKPYQTSRVKPQPHPQSAYREQRRNNEQPPWSSRPQEPPPFAYDNLADILRKMKEQYPNFGPRQTEWPKDKPKGGMYDDDGKRYYYDHKSQRAKKVTRKLKCKTCGDIIETMFVGAPEVFECNNCQWTAYQRNRK